MPYSSLVLSFRLQFLSHAGMCHAAVHWGNNEVLLFTDPNHIGLVDTSEFRSASALETHRKNVQLGLRIGQAALFVFSVGGVLQKAIWILMHNKLFTTKGGADPATKNSFWKFVVPVISHFAWLPESIAHSFCADALGTWPQVTYADPALCYDDLENIEGPNDAKRGFGVPAVLKGLCL